jgi:hypothetical protein
MVFFIAMASGHYVREYYINFPFIQAKSWKAGLKEAVTNLPDDELVYITDFASSPYIYVLFYNKLVPGEYLGDIEYYVKDNANLTHVKRLGRYNFITDARQAGEGILIDEAESGQMERIR